MAYEKKHIKGTLNYSIDNTGVVRCGATIIQPKNGMVTIYTANKQRFEPFIADLVQEYFPGTEYKSLEPVKTSEKTKAAINSLLNIPGISKASEIGSEKAKKEKAPEKDISQDSSHEVSQILSQDKPKFRHKKGKEHHKFKGLYIVGGKPYQSCREAEKATGINYKTIYYRCVNNIWPYSFQKA